MSETITKLSDLLDQHKAKAAECKSANISAVEASNVAVGKQCARDQLQKEFKNSENAVLALFDEVKAEIAQAAKEADAQS